MAKVITSLGFEKRAFVANSVSEYTLFSKIPFLVVQVQVGQSEDGVSVLIISESTSFCHLMNCIIDREACIAASEQKKSPYKF